MRSFSKVFESIRIDRDLHVQLQFNSNPLPLPPWFIQGTDAKLKRFSMLENFPAYIKNLAGDNPYSFIDELERRRNFKPKGRPSIFFSDDPVCITSSLYFLSVI